jgi:hypothetical protein
MKLLMLIKMCLNETGSKASTSKDWSEKNVLQKIIYN